MKTWSDSDIRKLARNAAQGDTSRGAYLRALIETAQAEGGTVAALKATHARFYPVVQAAVITPDIAPANRAAAPERKRRALERNRRSNFARSAYATVRRWLKVEGHDLMALKAVSVTKSQLLAEAPPAKSRTLTPERAQARANAMTKRLLDFTKQIAKTDRVQAAEVINGCMQQLAQSMFTGAHATTDVAVARAEHRPLRVGRATFWPMARAA